MAQIWIEKIIIQGKERHASKFKQERCDLVVLQTLPPHIVTDLPNMNSPLLKKFALTLQDVFIQNVHAGTRFNTYSGAVYSAE